MHLVANGIDTLEDVDAIRHDNGELHAITHAIGRKRVWVEATHIDPLWAICLIGQETHLVEQWLVVNLVNGCKTVNLSINANASSGISSDNSFESLWDFNRSIGSADNASGNSSKQSHDTCKDRQTEYC